MLRRNIKIDRVIFRDTLSGDIIRQTIFPQEIIPIFSGTQVLVDGVWKESILTSVLVDGTWRTSASISVLVDGNWEIMS